MEDIYQYHSGKLDGSFSLNGMFPMDGKLKRKRIYLFQKILCVKIEEAFKSVVIQVMMLKYFGMRSLLMCRLRMILDLFRSKIVQKSEAKYLTEADALHLWTPPRPSLAENSRE